MFAVCASPLDRAIDLGGGGNRCLIRTSLQADERLREKEFGILDRLTTFGIRERHPELSEQRAHVGKFYFRPPGGESWCDVILRLRSVIDTLTREYRGERVLIVAHQVIVNCFRYLLERMDEAQILELDRVADVPNCAVMYYEFDPHAWQERQAGHRADQFRRSACDDGHADHDRGRRAGGTQAMTANDAEPDRGAVRSR